MYANAENNANKSQLLRLFILLITRNSLEIRISSAATRLHHEIQLIIADLWFLAITFFYYIGI